MSDERPAYWIGQCLERAGMVGANEDGSVALARGELSDLVQVARAMKALEDGRVRLRLGSTGYFVEDPKDSHASLPCLDPADLTDTILELLEQGATDE